MPGPCENAMPSIFTSPADLIAFLITDAMWVAWCCAASRGWRSSQSLASTSLSPCEGICFGHDSSARFHAVPPIPRMVRALGVSWQGWRVKASHCSPALHTHQTLPNPFTLDCTDRELSAFRMLHGSTSPKCVTTHPPKSRLTQTRTPRSHAPRPSRPLAGSAGLWLPSEEEELPP